MPRRDEFRKRDRRRLGPGKIQAGADGRTCTDSRKGVITIVMLFDYSAKE